MSISNDFGQQVRKVTISSDKSKGYFTLPTFALGVNPAGWRGSSEIVGQFNYQATKNFTLQNVPEQPASDSGVFLPFILCIKYRIGGTVYRYKLWHLNDYNGVICAGDVYVPYYDGQIIKKNFTLELWQLQHPDISSLAMAPSLTTAYNFPISIRKVKDTLDEADEHEDNVGTEIERADTTVALPQDLDFSLPDVSVGDNN